MKQGGKEVVDKWKPWTVEDIITVFMFHVAVEDDEHESEDAGDELGGLFQVRRPDKESKEKANALDCSKFLIEKPQDWDLEEVMHLDNYFCKSYNGYVLGMSSKALLSCY